MACTPNNAVDFYVVGGQSNADGRISSITCPVADGTGLVSGLQLFDPGVNKNFANWKFGTNGGGANNASTLWAFDVIALSQMATYKAKTLYVLKHTLGSTSMLSTLANNGNWSIPYDNSVSPSQSQLMKHKIDFIYNRLAVLGKVPNFKGIIWHQGEGDYQNSGTYKALMVTWIATLRSWCRNSSLPFFYGTISTSSAQYNSGVDTAQRQIATEVPNCYLVDMSAGTLFDGFHFDATTAQGFGTSVFNLMKNAGL